MGATGGSSGLGGWSEMLLSDDNYYGEKYGEKHGKWRNRQIVGDIEYAKFFFDKITEKYVREKITKDKRYGLPLIRRHYDNGDWSTLRLKSETGGPTIENIRIRDNKQYIEKIHINKEYIKKKGKRR